MNGDLSPRTIRTRFTPRLDRVLGTSPITRFARWATSDKLRVIAYHDVTDPASFSRHLDIIQDFNVVSGDEVIAALKGGQRLRRRSIWLTFDDAHYGVLAHALPMLIERELPATLFVCPGLVDTDQPYWWQIIEAALDRGEGLEFAGRTWSDPSLITYLKRVPDPERRALVADVAAELTESGSGATVRQATSVQLRDWLSAGFDLGNHTWDHPCLDTCADEQQREQIAAAHEWLRQLVGRPTRLFAYPNGNATPASRSILGKFGYVVTALFDHRLSRLNGPELSRLRVDADTSADRFAAIASGAHSAAFSIKRQLQRRR